jgi:phosphatidylserine decarboxylase
LVKLDDFPGLRDRALLAAVRLMPRHMVTRAVGGLAGLRQPKALARLAVRRFARRYALDLDEAQKPLDEYHTVRELFTRRLKEGARPLAPGAEVPVAPADGRIYACGEQEAGQLIQAKGVQYPLAALLADEELAHGLEGGSYVTIYLSPHDYHRVHSPLSGHVSSVSYVPGDLFPVNPASAALVKGLFTRNERLVFALDTSLGPCAVVMVGATVVGRLRATFEGATADGELSFRPRRPTRRLYRPTAPIAKGAELGVFDMGSTVVVCFAPQRVRLAPGLVAGAKIALGSAL